MKKIVLLCATLLNIGAYEETPKISLELDVFGLSYHTNREYNFNEVNPGIGLSLTVQNPENQLCHFSAVTSAGTYKDSYRNQAVYALIGPRFTLGYDDSFHVSATVQAGYMQGSGQNGFAYVPFITMGYDWIDVGLTGNPFGNGKKEREDYTKWGAVFLKFKLLDF